MIDATTQEALVDLLHTECQLSVERAQHLAREMVKAASTHLSLMTRECNIGLNTQQHSHLATIEKWFTLIADSLPGITEASFDGDVRSTTVFIKLSSGSSNSFTGKWRIPVSMPATPGTALMKTMKQDIARLIVEQNQRNAQASRTIEVSPSLSVHDIAERILLSWIAKPLEIKQIGQFEYNLTATHNGIKMFTTGKSIMASPSENAPAQEIQAISCFFFNEKGDYVNDFNGTPGADEHIGTATDILERMPELSLAKWVHQ
jgi:hypothetical protein